MIPETITAEEGDCLFLSYASLDGYRVTVNGKKVEFVDCGLNLMLVPLEEGENAVSIEYVSPYFRYIGIGIAAALLLSALWYFILVKRKKILEKLSPLLSFAAYALSAFIGVAFAVFPLGIYLYKLIIYIF